MAHSYLNDPSSNIGRQLTLDVLALALTLPAIAQGSFSDVIVPFAIAAAAIFVAMFLIPFKHTAYVSERYARDLSGLRYLVTGVALGNLVIPGFGTIEFMSGRWIIMIITATLALIVVAVDSRRAFS